MVMLSETRTESGRMILNMGPQHPSTHGVLRLPLDLGATTVFMYCWREREQILSLNEFYTGVRMMTSFVRIGGVLADVPDGFEEDRKSTRLNSSHITISYA